MPKHKLYKLESLRGFAACYVIIYHVFMNVHFNYKGIDLLLLLRFGQEGVILFFLLSGFVINYSFETGKDKTFKRFFLKRFTRIYIPLLFVFALSYFFECMTTGSFIDPQFKTLAGNFFMLQDVHIKPNVCVGTYMGNMPLWSLSYEWWFYMFFYILMKLKTTKQQRIAVAIFIAVSGVSYVFYPFTINRFLFYFAMWWAGLELSKIYINKEKFSFQSLSYIYGILVFSFFICIMNVVRYYAIHGSLPSIGVSPLLEIRHFFFALTAIILSITWNSLAWKGFDKTIGWFSKVAPVSYALYIFHWPVLIKRNYLDFIHYPFIQFCVALILLIVISILIEVIIYPFLRKQMFSIAFNREKYPRLIKV